MANRFSARRRSSCVVFLLAAVATLAGCGGETWLAGDSFAAAWVEAPSPAAPRVGVVRGEADPVPLSLGVPDVTLDELGYQNRAFRAGDLDGDGYGDWVAQHWLPDTGSFLRLRYGGARPASDGDAMALALGGARLLLGPGAGRHEVLTAVGDLNGDGHDETFVAPNRCDPAQASSAYLLYGGSNLCAVGDLDGDGAEELLISSRLRPPDEGCALDIAPLEPQLHLFYGAP